jgi:hypothetical protein
MPRGSNPGERRGGRQKGTPNKLTGELKEMILEAANLAGGAGGTVQYLQTQASANPTAFMSLLGRVLPMTVGGDKDNPINIRSTIEINIVDPAD